MQRERPPQHHYSAFGPDAFGRWAEAAARFFGSPKYIVGQTIAVVVWVFLNAVGVVRHWDPYPFILLNLAFSLQAAYAAPLILLAQTRQADRDKLTAEMTDRHRDKIAASSEEHLRLTQRTTDELKRLLEANTTLTRQDKELTEQVATLTREIHARLAPPTTLEPG
jgi:uncharacterized membrane protein